MGIIQQLVDEGHVREPAENDDKALLDWLSRQGAVFYLSSGLGGRPVSIGGDVRAAIRWAMREATSEPPTQPFCDGTYWHSYRPIGDTWACLTCGRAADRDPARACTHSIFGDHKWYGHDAKGLFCPADAIYNVAERVHCACGATIGRMEIPPNGHQVED